MPPAFVIAVDGPAGAGKSTVARAVAARLPGFRYLDTGAMYRAVTAYLLKTARPNASPREMEEAAKGLELRAERYVVHGDDVTSMLRSPEVTAEVSRISAVPGVRRAVQAKQREATGRLVAEGRDIGSVVFPDAALKVYLDAALEQRAERRHREYPGVQPAEFARTLDARDRADSSRDDSPLVCPADAVRIDTTRLTAEEVVEHVVALAREHLDDPKAQGVGPAPAGQRGSAPA